MHASFVFRVRWIIYFIGGVRIVDSCRNANATDEACYKMKTENQSPVCPESAFALLIKISKKIPWKTSNEYVASSGWEMLNSVSQSASIIISQPDPDQYHDLW